MRLSIIVTKNPGYNDQIVNKKRKTLIKLVEVKASKNIFVLLINLGKNI